MNSTQKILTQTNRDTALIVLEGLLQRYLQLFSLKQLFLSAYTCISRIL